MTDNLQANPDLTNILTGGCVKPTAILYQLQQVDSKIDRLKARLAEITQQLNENEAVRAARQTLSDAETERQDWHAKQTTLNLERDQLKAERDETYDRMYGGKIHNPRELTDLQDKYAELKRRIEEIEGPLLEAMFGVESGDEVIVNAQASLEQVLKDQSQLLGELTDEQYTHEAEVSELQADADELRGKVEQAHLAQYDELRKRPGGIAVAPLNGDDCGVCASQIITRVVQQAKRGEVVTCTTCGRILHNK